MLGLFGAPAMATIGDVPHNHPSVEILSKFSPHFRCPYANDWVTSGPKQALINLGLLNITKSNDGGSVRRRLNAVGSCTYTNSWTGQGSCLEFRGDSWTETSMEERCASETDSTMSTGVACEVSPALAGYCVVGEGGSIEATPMEGMECDMAQTTCENFVQGTFTRAGACSEGGPPQNVFPDAVDAPSEPVSCAIAPGKPLLRTA